MSHLVDVALDLFKTLREIVTVQYGRVIGGLAVTVGTLRNVSVVSGRRQSQHCMVIRQTEISNHGW